MDDFEEHLNRLLTDTFSYILKYEELSLKTVSGIPITVAEAHMIEVIGKAGGSTFASDISSSLNISMPTVTVAVKKLEGKGFITKTASTEDGRRAIITLTELGKRVDRAHGLFHRRMVRNISSGFDADEKEVLLSSIKKLSVFFKEKVEA